MLAQRHKRWFNIETSQYRIDVLNFRGWFDHLAASGLTVRPLVSLPVPDKHDKPGKCTSLDRRRWV